MLIRTVARFSPGVRGRNWAEIRQRLPGAAVAPVQRVSTRKSDVLPSTEISVIWAVSLLWFRTLSSWAGVIVPAVWEPNAIAAGSMTKAGCGGVRSDAVLGGGVVVSDSIAPGACVPGGCA